MDIPPDRILAWVQKHFEYKVRKSDEITICNPLRHSNTNRFNFNISLSKAVCHDWASDDWSGPANPKTGKRNCSFLKFVQLYLKCPFKQAVEAVLGYGNAADFLRPKTGPESIKLKEEATVALPVGSTLLADSTDPTANICKIWLKGRGYTEDDFRKYSLYHAGLDVVWPYFEWGEMVYYQSRSRNNKIFRFPDINEYDETGKIIAKSPISKSDFLYGFDFVDPATHIVITEAIIDAKTVGDDTVASGGAILTERQIGKIKLLGPKDGVILAPDNDVAGLKSILSNYGLLKGSFKCYYSIPEIGKAKDWNDVGKLCGWGVVHDIMVDNIKRLDDRALITIRKKINQLETTGKAINYSSI